MSHGVPSRRPDEGEQASAAVAPRVFYLAGCKTQEVPLDWYQRRLDDPIEERHSIEIAPGVRVQVLGWGGGILPDKSVGEGVWIAAWADPAEARAAAS